ncbi:MAG TPA: PQQ-binding-like beta-propeller repeat protein [Acidimicrobiia bacterium]|nr:PQQ-binding-like beta-propeller repeat protein [Acidimicrobiia bacterium]
MRSPGRWTVVLSALVVAFSAAACDWTTMGYSSSNTKFNPEGILSSGNVATLHQYWSFDTGGVSDNGNTVVVGAAGATTYAYVNSRDGWLRAVNTATHGQAWAQNIHNTWNFPNAVPSFVTSSPLLTTVNGTPEIVATSYDGHIYAFNAQTGTPAWSIGIYKPIASSPVLTSGGNIIVLVDSAIPGSTNVLWQAIRINPATGTTTQVLTLGTLDPYFGATSVAIDGANHTAYLGWGDSCAGGALQILDVDGSFTAGWKRTLSAVCTVGASPAVSGGHVYLNTNSGLYSLRESDGATEWLNKGGLGTVEPEFSSPAVAGGLVVVGNGGAATVRAVHTDGTTAWSVSCGFPSSPVSTGNLVLEACGNAGNVKVVGLSAGGTVISLSGTTAHAVQFGSMSIANGLLFVPGYDGRLRVFGR